jgi:hypothetical protein
MALVTPTWYLKSPTSILIQNYPKLTTSDNLFYTDANSTCNIIVEEDHKDCLLSIYNLQLSSTFQVSKILIKQYKRDDFIMNTTKISGNLLYFESSTHERILNIINVNTNEEFIFKIAIPGLAEKYGSLKHCYFYKDKIIFSVSIHHHHGNGIDGVNNLIYIYDNHQELLKVMKNTFMKEPIIYKDNIYTITKSGISCTSLMNFDPLITINYPISSYIELYLVVNDNIYAIIVSGTDPYKFIVYDTKSNQITYTEDLFVNLENNVPLREFHLGYDAKEEYIILHDTGTQQHKIMIFNILEVKFVQTYFVDKTHEEYNQVGFI